MILVTGHAGFIGSHFVDYLEKSCPYTGNFIYVDKGTYAHNPECMQRKEGWTVQADIADFEAMDYLIKHNGKVNRIINFAAESHVDNSILDDRSFIETNIVGTVNLLKLADKYGPMHFHHISTDEVYGSVESPVPEWAPYNPRNPYSASKAAADHFVSAYKNTFKLDATISRCCNNFGPRQHDEKFIPTVIRSILREQPIPVYGDGHNTREWLYVKDHVRFLFEFICDRRNYHSINLGPGRSLSNLEMISEIGNLMRTMYPAVVTEEPIIQFVTDRKGHDRNYFLDCSEFKKAYKMEKTPFHEAMTETIEYYYERYKNA